MATKITASARRELVQALRERYQRGARGDKSRILTEFVAVSGYHRKHAIRVLSGAEQITASRRPSRPRLYDEAVQQALRTLWEASDRVCGKRLRPLLPILVSSLEHHGHLRLDDTIRRKVLAMSSATIDRLLSTTRAVTSGATRRPSKPAVRRSVPVRTFADWKEPLPGSTEIDLVAHCGQTVAGSFVSTLVLTDITSGWTDEIGQRLPTEPAFTASANPAIVLGVPVPGGLHHADPRGGVTARIGVVDEMKRLGSVTW